MSSIKQGFYIIESLDFDDEQKDRFEGSRISDILNRLDIENQY
jgi:hypothetical protein